ncbi:dihydrolipoyl dehydrogenase [bacterium BMS3Abin04]|nr:dihydrolipoyl dehydrogenase [bacterium BMS3Abin04]
MNNKYDIAVLGGGPGGYVAAIRASQLGFKTVVIEKGKTLGGVCLNWGCIPTKALLKSAESYDLMKNHSHDLGINVKDIDFDFEKIIKRSRNVSRRVTKGVDYLMKKNKIDVKRGFGKIISKNTISILDDNKKEIEKVSFTNLIIATGARTRIFNSIPVDREKIITSTEAMTLEKLPKEMIIVGAGAIGVEFAYFYNVLGTKVTLVEMLDRIVPVEDSEVSETLKRSFAKRGIEIYTSAKVENAQVKGRKVDVNISNEDGKKQLKADIVLSAVGVVGNVEGFGLEKLGVKVERNSIVVDKKTYKTNIDNIYAVGDVIGPPWLAHVASHEGIHCVEGIKGLKTPALDYNSIPGCTYCHPQIASIGFTEEIAVKKGYKIKVGKFPYSASGKATAAGDREGFVKLIFDEEYGELLGAHIIGDQATEMIAELGIAKTLEGDFESIAKTVHAHPTLSEMIMEAAEDANGQAIDI